MFWLPGQEYDNVFLGDLDFSSFTNDAGGLDWNAIINQGFALGSQVVGAVGKRPTTQIGYNANTDSIFAIGQAPANPYGYSSGSYGQYGGIPSGLTPAQIAALQKQSGLGLDDAAGSITSFISRNPLLVFGGLAAMFLLYKQPPGRR